MGLELVSIELDDPFGDDDNDFEYVRRCVLGVFHPWSFCPCFVSQLTFLLELCPRKLWKYPALWHMLAPSLKIRTC
jgi:hypothetical protein